MEFLVCVNSGTNIIVELIWIIDDTNNQ